jgi:prepilin-type N-terminal cleavage/methylation domain-containing protein
MKLRPLKHSENGFTLIEIMTVTAVTGILLVIIMVFVSNSLVSTTVQSARSDLLREAQQGLDGIGRDIRLSASAEENNRWEDENAPGAPTDLLSWESDNDTLILATAAIDTENNVLFQDPLQYITYKNNVIYFVEGGTLFRRTLAADIADNAARTSCPKQYATSSCKADSELMNNVTDFSVRYLSGDDEEVTPPNARSVEISVKLQTTKYGRVLDAEYLTRMVFRNE